MSKRCMVQTALRLILRWRRSRRRLTTSLMPARFEKVYRFTPFFNDAQKRIRGKCPLELAGYEVQKLPMARLFRGLALQWPASSFQELVPNV